MSTVWAFPPAPPDLAPSRRFHCSATVKNKVYVFGGETKMKSPEDAPAQESIKRMLADLIVYDAEVEDWEVVCPASPTGPARRKGSVLVAYKDMSLLLFGGAGPGVTLNDLWEFNLKERKWIDRSKQVIQSLLQRLPAEFPITRELWSTEDSYKLAETIAQERPDLYPSPRAYHTAVVYGSKIFLYGGHGVKAASSTLWTFDLETYVWHNVPMQAVKSDVSKVDPGCRFGLTSCVLAGNMYIYGGQQNGKLVNTALWRLDLETLCWHQVAATGTPPGARTYGASCLIGNRWLIHGGSTAEHVYADAHEIDLELQVWHPAHALHTLGAMEGHQAVCTRAPWGGLSVMLLGGATSGPVAPDGPLLRCDFLLPLDKKLTGSTLVDYLIQPTAAAELIWMYMRAATNLEQQMTARQRAEKEMSETLDNLRLRHDEMCERYELLLQERKLMARTPQAVPPDVTKLKELQSKVEDLQAQLTRYANRKQYAKEETTIAETRYEEVIRREQIIVEHMTTTTRQLRTTRQRIREELEFPLTRLAVDVSHDQRLFDIAEASLRAAERVSEDVTTAIRTLREITLSESASPLSSSRVSRPKSTTRSASVHDSAKRRPARPSVSPSRAAARSKSASADSAQSGARAAVRNKSVGKRPAAATPEGKTSGTPVHRHTEHVKTTTTVRHSSPAQESISTVGAKSKQHVDEPSRQSTRAQTRQTRTHETIQKAESLVDAAAAGQHMSSPVQQTAPARVQGVNRGVSVTRTSRPNATGDLVTHESAEARVTMRKNMMESTVVSPIGIDRSTQCGSGVLKLKTSQNVAETEKVSARSAAGISKGIGADT